MRLKNPKTHTGWLMLMMLMPFQMACGKIKEPVFEAIDSMRITGVREGGIITADVKVRIRNENKLSYSGNEMEMSIFHKQVLVAIGKAADSLQIPADNTVSFLMHVEFFSDSLMADSYDILYQDSIPLQIKVNGKFGALRIPSKTEINHNLKTSQLMDIFIKENLGKKQIQVEKTILKEFNSQTSTIISKIRFKNTLPLDLNIESIMIDIFSDSKYSDRISAWSDSVPFTISQGKDTLMVPEFKINTVSTAFTGLLKTISGNNIYYAAGHTEVKFGSKKFKVPLKFRFRFDPIKQETDVID
jgi:hypothetical protein